MHRGFMKAPFLIGRLLFGGYFLYNGINHLRNREQMAPYAESKGVPNQKWPLRRVVYR
jgi:putative oxidoreductase